ncbi:nickel transport protein [Methanohalophilus levihalophilus]|uniref:carboxypeptidase-like regulatory domain-containing protein n=1 Tax=Methanohalophilus levihalophilus TaxID=1431282 RepID=UPI001FD9261D|nr:carboxypeptidase-like regulatory domain-containing protein [Methanohalophilus levihalophilus]MBP2030590.1 nickel transport protein [Methanohalophilus levihalophilus]
MKYGRVCCIIVFAAIIFSTIALPVSAHRVYLMEQVNEVEIKAWYGGGDPIINGEITVYAIKNGDEEVYLEGVTDEEGLYHFTPKLGVSEYRVIVSQMGHQDELNFNLKGETGDVASETSPENTELPLAANIVAGIGYIAGIAGIAMILKARKIHGE